MVFSVATLLEHISRFQALTAGELLLTGTPAGVGLGVRSRLGIYRPGIVYDAAFGALVSNTIRSRRLPNRLDEAESLMKISLSIDNGPTPDVTPRVLDTLARLNCPASFFVLGSKINTSDGRALVQRAKKEGHRIGNHTYSHTILFGVAEEQSAAIDEVENTQSLLDDLGSERLFRPYGGGGFLDESIMSRTVHSHLRNGKYTCVLWNCIPLDWEDPAGWPKRAMANVRINPWSVIVIHDLPTGAMDVLGEFINRACDIGGEFVREFPEAVTPLVRGEEIWSMQQRGLLSDR